MGSGAGIVGPGDRSQLLEGYHVGLDLGEAACCVVKNSVQDRQPTCPARSLPALHVLLLLPVEVMNLARDLHDISLIGVELLQEVEELLPRALIREALEQRLATQVAVPKVR
jgi:hypothetical protein